MAKLNDNNQVRKPAATTIRNGVQMIPPAIINGRPRAKSKKITDSHD
tara:strand:+ start:242 stop:382 length:141 start_codon:yes stop_codon:yes gene_type:complete